MKPLFSRILALVLMVSFICQSYPLAGQAQTLLSESDVTMAQAHFSTQALSPVSGEVHMSLGKIGWRIQQWTKQMHEQRLFFSLIPDLESRAWIAFPVAIGAMVLWDIMLILQGGDQLRFLEFALFEAATFYVIRPTNLGRRFLLSFGAILIAEFFAGVGSGHELAQDVLWNSLHPDINPNEAASYLHLLSPVEQSLYCAVGIGMDLLTGLFYLSVAIIAVQFKYRFMKAIAHVASLIGLYMASTPLMSLLIAMTLELSGVPVRHEWNILFHLIDFGSMSLMAGVILLVTASVLMPLTVFGKRTELLRSMWRSTPPPIPTSMAA